MVELIENLQHMVNLLENTIEDKDRELELERNRKNAIKVEAVEDGGTSSCTLGSSTTVQLLNTQGSYENMLSGGVDSDLNKEIEALKEKVRELENHCNELTKENLELIIKLKESKKDLRVDGAFFCSATNELQSTVSPPASEPQVDVLRSQIHSQDKACELDAQLGSSQLEMEEHVVEINALKQQLQSYQEKQTSKGFQHNILETGFQRFESHKSTKRSELLSELYNQLQVALAHVKRPWYKGSSHVNTEREIDHNDLVGSYSSNITTQKFHAEAILNQFTELNKLLEMKTSECEIVFQRIEAEVKDKNACVTDAVENLEQYDLKENTPHSPSQELGNLKTKPEANADLNNNLLAKGTEPKVLETSLLLKKEDIEVLRHSQKEVEAHISAKEQVTAFTITQ